MTSRFLTKDDLHALKLFLKSTNEDIDRWTFFFRSLETPPKAPVYINGVFEDSVLTRVGVGYTINAVWNVENTLPYWVAGRTVFADRGLPNIGKHIEDLMEPISRAMEENGYFVFYMCRLVPATLNFQRCWDYMTESQGRRNGIDRYRATLEALYDTPDSVQTMPDLYKMIGYRTWPKHRKMAIIRHDLNPEYR